ncbi:hypothetical protein BHM03_00061206 [Ensete ventricosum]|nr:hypothetical protein BHM03_00061206 [Ensete ventricosum]
MQRQQGSGDREERGGREMAEAAAAEARVRCGNKRVKDNDDRRVAVVARGTEGWKCGRGCSSVDAGCLLLRSGRRGGAAGSNRGDDSSWKKRKNIRAAIGFRRDSTVDVEQEQGRKTTPRGQWLRTSGGVPFLLKMPTTRSEGTAATGKSGRRRLAAVGGEIAAGG